MQHPILSALIWGERKNWPPEEARDAEKIENDRPKVPDVIGLIPRCFVCKTSASTEAFGFPLCEKCYTEKSYA